MRLPGLLVVTDRAQAGEPLEDALVRLADNGVRGVVLREKDLPYDERSRLVDRVVDRLADHDVVLLVAIGRDGRPAGPRVHLAADADFPTPRPEIVGRSCHDAGEVGRAAAEGCDYVTVSPVFPSDSKPGYGPCLGPDGLGRLLAGAPPAYALGGVLPGHVEACLSAGAAGVAVMGPLMREPALAADYLAALGQET
ncbi:thiamine phosphate synthase [Nocardioides panaciterrulae]|uniref:Thiamine-phosphate pyrophosphorylase n=1 Tax=Nocardioides panaciterrulae TaxID=661492 RepID=A0A7Y9E7Q3_9ACTN|nr:thiamine-phosphate pyrophosphorylase [Nocardioides panaciterrulae]